MADVNIHKDISINLKIAETKMHSEEATDSGICSLESYGSEIFSNSTITQSQVTESDNLETNECSEDEIKSIEEEGEIVSIQNENETGENDEELIRHDTNNLKNEPIIKVQFKDLKTYHEFSKIFSNFFTNMGFCFQEEKHSLVISCFDNQVVNKTPEVDKQKALKKRKRKRKKSKDECDSLFVLDTTPSISTHKNKVLKYESKFNIKESTKKGDETEDNSASLGSANNCFNCNENHNLKDCPLPRDNARISIARSKFRNVSKNGRYHLEDDQKYGHLKPGQISDSLKKALGLSRNQLPVYIYRMRRLGYPPGWLEEAQVVHSDLTMYDFEGKNIITNKRKRPFVDPEKIIDYPGFNTPIGKGFKDEYRMFGVPPYSERFAKENMLQHIKKLEEKEQDNLDTEDMELESIMSDKESAPLSHLPDHLEEKEIDSPSLIDLESKKDELLAELNDNTNGSSTSLITINETSPEDTKKVTCKEKQVTIEKKSITETTALCKNGKLINVTEEIECEMFQEEETKESSSEIMETTTITTTTTTMTTTKEEEQDEEKGEESILSEENVTLNNSSVSVKTSAFGTPILKSDSPYSRLPKPENFSKDICDVINFENLPNSTGKYEQMTEVLQKVRKTLKNLHEKNS